MMNANGFPLLAAVNALIEVRDAFLYITIEHIIFVNLGSASSDDLVRDLGEKSLHSL
jgi:hypothetical protein